MKGRRENELKVFSKIEEYIENSPTYIKRYKDTISDMSYTTQNMYIRYIIDFLSYIDANYDIDIRYAENLSQIKKSTVSAYLNSLKNNGSSIKASKLYGIKKFFEYLVDDEYIMSNPCDKVKVPKNKEEHQIISLTKDEIETVKNNIFSGCGSNYAKRRQHKWMNRDYAIVMLGLSSGLRVTSIAEINVDDIDFSENKIRVTEKGNKTRDVYFGDGIKNIILKWMEDREEMLEDKDVVTDALFISCQMKRITSKSIYDLVKKYTSNIDKPISPHKLRSTCATNLYNNTGDIYLVADTLGHSNIANTKRYAMIDKDRKKVAAKTMNNILF